MGQVLHGSATTTHAIRAAIQRSKASIQALSERLRNQSKDGRQMAEAHQSSKTAEWGRRCRTRRCCRPRRKLLIVAFRRHTLLPLDDCLYALQATVPHLTRSSLHRLFQRHGDQPPAECGGHARAPEFKAYPIGYIHIDLAEVWTDEGKLYLFVAIDRVSKFAFAELHERATPRIAADFLRRLIERVPYTDPHGPHRQRVSIHAAPWRLDCRRDSTDAGRPISRFAPMPLTSPARSCGSTIASRNSNIRGPMGKSNE